MILVSIGIAVISAFLQNFHMTKKTAPMIKREFKTIKKHCFLYFYRNLTRLFW